MITFDPCVTYIKKSGYAQVYLRVTKDSYSDYMKTKYITHKNEVDKQNRVKDVFILAELMPLIKKYYEHLRLINTDSSSVKDIIKYLEVGTDSTAISFTDFYKGYVAKMKAAGRKDPASNYQCAINHLLKFANVESLTFAGVTSKLINKWIESMSGLKRAKNMYPTCISTVFHAGCLEYNDYENDVIRIKNQPFLYVKIPKNDEAEKKSVERDALIKVFGANISDASHTIQTQRAQDVGLMIFCLAGINIVDLYKLKKTDRVGNKLIYNRSKTKGKRSDSARMEITIPEPILGLFSKYAAKGDGLLSFSEQVNTSKNFLKTCDNGFEELSRIAGVSKVSSYTFRHTWATVAEVNLKYTEEQVGFCLNHSSAHKTTRLYIRKDYSIVDEINDRVIGFVFNK